MVRVSRSVTTSSVLLLLLLSLSAAPSLGEYTSSDCGASYSGYSYQKNVNYPGNDLYSLDKVQNISTCLANCTSNPDCVGFGTYNIGGGLVCFLKTALVGQEQSGYDDFYVECTLPAPNRTVVLPMAANCGHALHGYSRQRRITYPGNDLYKIVGMPIRTCAQNCTHNPDCLAFGTYIVGGQLSCYFKFTIGYHTNATDNMYFRCTKIPKPTTPPHPPPPSPPPSPPPPAPPAPPRKRHHKRKRPPPGPRVHVKKHLKHPPPRAPRAFPPPPRQ